MEKRSPYVLIGAAVMLFVAAVVGFVIWKLRAGDQTSYAYYVILFSGDVQGLTADSPVYYRGLRVIGEQQRFPVPIRAKALQPSPS